MLALEVSNISKRFDSVQALHDVSLSVPTGRVLALLGPNGSGKTTLLRILATLLRPDSGWARVLGNDVVTGGHAVRQLIGVAGQYSSIDDLITGRTNLALVGRLLGMSRTAAGQRAEELLDRFDLSAAGGRAVKHYSGGMRRRIDLAASLIGSPRLVYLDEPTTGLDPRSRNALWLLIRNLVANGTTVLLTTQYLEEADALADEVVVLDHGRVIARGTPAELKSRTKGRTLAVRPLDPHQLALAAHIVSGLSGDVSRMEGDFVVVPLMDPSLLPAIVASLRSADVVIDEMHMRTATLDEVFLSLTSAPSLPGARS